MKQIYIPDPQIENPKPKKALAV